MDRNRDSRKTTMTSGNGLSRRRHRSNALRDSPEEDGPLEFHETGRLRDRTSAKKDRDRDREREERDRERDRPSRSKRRRVDRLMHGNSRQDCADDSTEESVNVDEEEDDDTGEAVRMLPPNPSSALSSISNHLPRKSFPPAKIFRMASTWKVADEMIGVSVPRKARSVSTKRSHDSWIINSGGGFGGESTHRQSSTSPVRQNLAASSTCHVSPSSSTVSARKKTSNGSKQRPPKSSPKSCSSNQEEIEFEIAEVLYGLRQNQDPSKPEASSNDSAKFDAKDAACRSADAKSSVSSPISHSSIPHLQSAVIIPQNSSSSAPPVSCIVPRRKRPRPVKEESDDSSLLDLRNNAAAAYLVKAEVDQCSKIGDSLQNFNKNPGSALDNRTSFELADAVTTPLLCSETLPELLKTSNGECMERRAPREDDESKKKNESQGQNDMAASKAKTTSAVPSVENRSEERFEIDLMAPPPVSRSSPERAGDIDLDFTNQISATSDSKPLQEMKPSIEPDNLDGDDMCNEKPEEKVKHVVEELEVQNTKMKDVVIDLQLDLEKGDGCFGASSQSSNKHSKPCLKQIQQKKNAREELNLETTAPSSSSLPFPIPLSGWPGGISPMGYVGPLQGLVPLDGGAMSSMPIQTPHQFFSQPRPKRCATHCYIARNICYHQQFTKMNSLWPAMPGSVSLYGGRPPNLNTLASTEMHANFTSRNATAVQDKGQGLAIFPGHVIKDSNCQASNTADAQKKQQILIQQALPPGASSNLLHGPAFIFPLSPQQATSSRPASLKLPLNSTPGSTTASSPVPTSTPASVGGASFSYPNVAANETQYLAILQNNAYPFPIPAHIGGPSYRGTHGQAMPFFSGSFYSSHVLHSSQFQQQPSSSQVHQAPASSSQKQLQSLKSQVTTKPTYRSSKPPPQPQQSQHVGASHGRLEDAQNAERGGNINIYPQNFTLPIHLMPPGPQSDKIQQVKGGVESMPPSPAFAMSFASINGSSAAPVLDISSLAQNHALLKSTPEHGRHYQMLTQSTAGKSSIAENVEEERKVGGKQAQANLLAQSIAFSGDSSLPVNDSSVRTINLGSATSRLGVNSFNTSSSQHRRPQQPSRYIQTKSHSTSSDIKFPNTLSSFPQTSIHHAQSPQWKNVAVTSSSSLKTVPHQQSRGHISFGGNLKTSISANSQSHSPPMVAGSPSNSSVSKGGGSPKSGNKLGKGSPVRGMSVASIMGGKSLQQHPQQQMPNSKQTLQAQLFFSNPYLQSQVSAGNSGYYTQQRRRDNQGQPAAASSSGMLSLCPPVTTENVKAGKGGVLQGAQFPSGNSHSGFPYLHPVQLKSPEQKHPTAE